MKKVFTFEDPKIKRARMVDSAKSTINKYLKRERKKKLPEGTDFWDFSCCCGKSSEDAEEVHLKEVFGKIDEVEAAGDNEVYVEIVAEAGTRQKKAEPEQQEE